MKGNKTAHMVAFVLVIIGGLNWLLVAILGHDISTWLPGGDMGSLAKAIYVLVGISALYLAFTHKSDCKECSNA